MDDRINDTLLGVISIEDVVNLIIEENVRALSAVLFPLVQALSQNVWTSLCMDLVLCVAMNLEKGRPRSKLIVLFG